MNGKNILVGIALVTMSVGAQADDRDLLRSRGAPPNVLMVVDSSGSMTRDVATDNISYIGSGDDPHSKTYDLKEALTQFYDTYPDFNMGFTFYRRSNMRIGAHEFLYRLDPAESNLSWKWAITSENGTLKGRDSTKTTTLTAGALRRLGNPAPEDTNSEAFDPLFGATGTLQYVDWARSDERDIGGVDTPGNSSKVTFNGTTYTGKYRIDVWLEEPVAGTGYYYPAYAWNTAVQNAINAFQTTHDLWAPLVFDADGTPADRLAAFNTLTLARSNLQTVMDANQIGLPSLTLKATLRKCGGTLNQSSGTCSTAWTLTSSLTRHLLSAGGLTPHDITASDTNTRPYPPAITPLDYSNGDHTAIVYGDSCLGIEGEDKVGYKIPMVPIPTDDDPDMLPYLRSLLRPQAQMQFFFPTRPSGYKYWPYYWTDQSSSGMDKDGVWVTDRAIVATGSTPVATTLSDTKKYFEKDVFLRSDPFASCRKNFLIFITDGLETCSGDPCARASELGAVDVDIPVYMIGYGLGTDGNALSCIARNSHGELYLPNNVTELVEALRRVGQSIEERTRGFAAPMVPSVETTTAQKAYLSTFLPLGHRSIWQGHLRAYPINPATGRIPVTTDGFPDLSYALWDAGDRLRTKGHAGRVMYFGDEAVSGSMPGTRTLFTAPTTTAQRTKLRTYMLNPSLTDSQLNSIVAFMRGDRPATTPDGHVLYGGEILGDVFHAVPQLVGPPACYPCWLQNLNGYRDNLVTTNVPDDGFFATHKRRRQVLYASANDGAVHAFDAGLWNPTDYSYDDGTGDELFAWIPRAVMPTFEALTFGEDHQLTVDGTPTVFDAYVDRNFTTNPDPTGREWRSLLMVGQREGGRSYVCLDVTQPDTYDPDGVSEPASGASDRRPTCRLGGSECDGAHNDSGLWPDFRWEFTDTSDENGDGAPDLGQTWSRPLVGFVKVMVGSGPSAEQSRTVAIFGGGYEHHLETGRHLYMVDVETGKILFKSPTLGSVPADVAAIDLDLDGYLERLYWADTSGYVYRMDITTPGVVNATTKRVTSWQPQEFFYAGTSQPLFLRVALAPASFNADGTPMLAIAVGAGNRDDLFEENLVPHHFYVILDKNDYASVGTLTDSDLQAVDVAAAVTGSNFLVSSTLRGWYLVLSEQEKVNTPALIVNSEVIFSTFKQGEGVVIVPDPDNPGRFLCRRGGNAKTYVVNLFNANPGNGDVRFIAHSADVSMASEAVFYIGADGMSHGEVALNNGAQNAVIPPDPLAIRTLNWKEE